MSAVTALVRKDQRLELDGQLTAYAIKRGVTGVALFTDALARLECRTTATHDEIPPSSE